MTKKWIAIDLLLLGIAALIGWQLRLSIFQFNAENNVAKIQPARDTKQKIVQAQQIPQAVPVKNYNPAEFAAIPDKNVFSDTRSKEDKVEILPPPEPPPLAQKPILVGVTIDTQPRASVIDPTVPQGRDRRAQIKRIGDVYQGYTITDISPDHMVLESGTRKEIIPLHEGTKRVQQGKTPILSTRVVPFGGGGIAGGTPISISGGPPGAAPPRTTVAPVGSAATGQTASPAAPARTNAATPTPAPPPAAQPQSTPGVQILRTPFGDIRQPVP
jgi:hypothetical protein